MGPQSRKPRCVNDDDSLFSIESFKNRINNVRSAFSDLSSTGNLQSNEKGDIRDRDSDKHRAVSPITTMSENKTIYSPRDNQTYTSSSSSNNHRNCSEPMSPPTEIALLHRETDLLLSAIRADDNNFISPLKDDFYQHHDEDHQLNQLLNSGSNPQENPDDWNDSTSVSSILSDDDGLKNEVRELKFAIRAIRKDISSANLMMIASQRDDGPDEQTLNKNRLALHQMLLVVTILALCLLPWLKYNSIPNSCGSGIQKPAFITKDEFNPLHINYMNSQDEATQECTRSQDKTIDKVDLDTYCPRQFTLELS